MKKLIIKKIDLYIFILLLPLLETAYIANNLSTLHRLIVPLKYASIAIIIILYFAGMAKGSLSKPAMFVIMFSTISILSTLINSGEIRTAIMESLQLIAIVLAGDILARKSLKEYISVVYPVFFLLIFINFITMIIFPEGMYSRRMQGAYVWVSNNNWYLGLENGMTAYLVPTLALSYINMFINRKKKDYILAVFVTFICLYTPIIRNKGSMFICISLFICVCCLVYFKMLPSFINAKTYFILNIIFYLLIIVFNSLNANVISFADALLNRETLAVRAIIWDKTMNLIKERPLLGYGYELGYTVSDKLKYDSSHNEYLWVLYRGGLLQFLSFILFIICCAKNLFQKNDYAAVKVVSASFFVLLLMWQTESIMNNALMLYWTFIYYVGVKGDELFFVEQDLNLNIQKGRK